MSIIYNGTTITDLVYNGSSMDSVIYNDTTVYENKAKKDINITLNISCILSVDLQGSIMQNNVKRWTGALNMTEDHSSLHANYKINYNASTDQITWSYGSGSYAVNATGYKSGVKTGSNNTLSMVSSNSTNGHYYFYCNGSTASTDPNCFPVRLNISIPFSMSFYCNPNKQWHDYKGTYYCSFTYDGSTWNNTVPANASIDAATSIYPDYYVKNSTITYSANYQYILGNPTTTITWL